MRWYLKVLKQYADFGGRARRKEYWLFVAINLLVAGALAFVDGVVGTFDPQSGAGLLSGLYSLAVLVPGLAVSFRRLHDTGRSGWWLLLAFIPVVGFLVLIYFFVQDSEAGANAYGPNPKHEAAPAGGVA